MWSLSNFRIFNIFYPFPLFSPRSSRGWILTLDLWDSKSILLPLGLHRWLPKIGKLRGRPVQPHICSVNVAKNISKLFFVDISHLSFFLSFSLNSHTLEVPQIDKSFGVICLHNILFPCHTHCKVDGDSLGICSTKQLSIVLLKFLSL